MEPVQISFHGLEPSEALTELVEKRAQKLVRFNDRLIRCRVAIEAPHHHHQHGNHYRVRIELTVPGDEVIVSHAPPARLLDEDAYRAINHAFDSVRRQLTEDGDRRRKNTFRSPGPRSDRRARTSAGS